MAFTKEQKAEMLEQYQSWIKKSQAVILIEYKKMTMKDIDGLRVKVREMGGEVHIVKNTLLGRALASSGLSQPKNFLEGSTAVSFAFTDAPALAKILNDAFRGSEIFKVKGGYLGTQAVNAAEIKALAELPPLPVVRATLLGALMAPASQIVRTLAEPARSVAAVLKSYSEKSAVPAAE
ncbi:MAG: 50S ribosomal protein L10 [Chloroflexi bacterium]|nr:50S ribosomal protein L10 [Chloroflexota bacterium]